MSTGERTSSRTLTELTVVETIKNMFRFADGYFLSGFGEGGDLAEQGVSVQ